MTRPSDSVSDALEVGLDCDELSHDLYRARRHGAIAAAALLLWGLS
jgi:hypothetical protein